MKRHLVLTLALTLLLGVAAWSAPRLDGWQRGSEYNRLFNPRTVETVTGTITTLHRDLHPLPGMAEGFGATLETTDGRQLQLQIGPTWFTQNFRDDWKVAVGDQVEVRGSLVRLHGTEALMVTWGRKGEHVMTVRNAEGVPVWDVRVEGF